MKSGLQFYNKMTSDKVKRKESYSCEHLEEVSQAEETIGAKVLMY